MNIEYHIAHPIKAIKAILYYIIRKPKFKKYHITCRLNIQSSITEKYVSLGKHVYIGPFARIEGVPFYNKIEYEPHIIINENVSIQQNIHLTCANSVVVGKNTAIAANVTITDINHPYEDINIPVERQNLEVSYVYIGEDCKIYNNAVILPGVKIGKHCVIGANSVVTKDIPDYSIAVGSPAKIIKRYDFERKEWRKTNNEGQYLD